MTTSRFSVLFVATIVGSFLGGMAMEYMRDRPARADDTRQGGGRLKADGIEIVDELGRVRLALLPGLFLMEDERAGISERVVLGPSGLLLTKASPAEMVEMSVGPSGLMVTENGQPRLEVSVRAGEPSFRLRDDQGRVRSSVPRNAQR